MHGIVYRQHLGTVGEIYRCLLGELVDGADYREGGVEHNPGLYRVADIAVGIAHGDRPCGREECVAPHAEYGHGYEKDQCHYLCDIIPFQRSDWGAGYTVTSPQQRHHGHKQYRQIPVRDYLGAHDAADIPLALELVEHRHRGAVLAELEEHRVREIHEQAHGVDDDIYPLCGEPIPLALLYMEREQVEQYHQRVCIEDGRGVELESSERYLPERFPRHPPREHLPVFGQEGQSAHLIAHIYPEQVDYQPCGI